jgi:hypothetical protein
MTEPTTPATSEECWRFIRLGALPHATSVTAQGAPAWDLTTIVDFFQVPLDAVRAALAERARDAFADTARARHEIPAPDQGFNWPERRAEPRRKAAPVVSAKVRRELAGK